MDDEPAPEAPAVPETLTICPDCSESFATLELWQRHNLDHMLVPRPAEPRIEPRDG